MARITIVCCPELRGFYEMKIKLLFFDVFPNFGDMLNIHIPKLFGVDVEKGGPYECNAAFIGSVMSALMSKRRFDPRKFIYGPVKIWGAGFIKPEDNKIKLRRRMEIYALRGKLTLELMRKYTGRPLENVKLGDPGLLAPMLIGGGGGRKIEKKYKLGIIPHYVDAKSEHLLKIKTGNSVVIDILSNPISFMKQVAECETIIASAMHGLIAADSLGIPNARMLLSDGIIGGDYKYDDYYSAFGLDSHQKTDLRTIDFWDDVESVKKNYKIKPRQVAAICDALISVFPYKRTGFP